MIIVYCGDVWRGSTCRMRSDALRTLGHKLTEVDTTYVPAGFSGLALRALKKLGYTSDPLGTNERLLASVAREEPQVVWIDKGMCITPRTLQTIRELQPNTHTVNYGPDDMGGRHNQPRQYLDSIQFYDLHVTTKSFNVKELYGRGARGVLFVNNAYSTDTHRPIEVSPQARLNPGAAVGFIGAFERDRAESLRFLTSHGIQVQIVGAGWERWAKRNSDPNMRMLHRRLWGEEYTKAICSVEINLGFLRKLNRDLQTTRSVEIPACGSFMLAERTAEHLELFVEGVEAEFFSSREELLEKCRYYLTHREARFRVAKAGRERCLRSGYSYERQVEAVLDRLKGLRTGGNGMSSDV